MLNSLSSPVRRASGELNSAANGERLTASISLQALSSPVRRYHIGEHGELAHCFSSPVRHTRKGGERRAGPANREIPATRIPLIEVRSQKFGGSFREIPTPQVIRGANSLATGHQIHST